MRSRVLFVLALFSLPIELSAQGGVRLPRPGRTPQPATLPPEIPAVSRALALKRSRWSAEGYLLFSAIQVPGGSGGSDTYASAGGGTRADYRFADRFSATLDVAGSFLGFANSQTVEVGTRFVPTPRGEALRPYFDLRAAYMHINDTYVIPGSSNLVFGGPINQEFAQQGRYTGGLGGVVGAGFDYSLTNSLAFTTELSAFRARMNSYRLGNPASNTGDVNYWMTSLRYTIGLKYNPVQALHLVQKATQ